MVKNERKRIWKLAKQTAFSCGRSRGSNKTFKLSIKKTKKISKKITQTKTKNKKKKINGLLASDLNSALNCFPNFLGCVPEDKLDELVFGSLPCFIIVNIDSGNMPGSHWIALGLFKGSIEIFDPLGFDIFNWSKVPCDLLDFLHRLSVTRRVHTAPRVQSDSSYLCGFYTIFYVIARKFVSFEHLFKCFCTQFLSRNDKILYEFFKNAD